ncbi:CPBP family intramembrane glutamic endopeptidase [Paenibacillus riograndensis]|uniref:Abortive infection protein n=1 Tax=Paenibacillus riograndensis SBR5 TaxID=1073571 RepID=A0A0E3WI80_9BACL|nr:CPBP family intramembrane glutamic endopeptidase [Paenibacillus riograndensis]CQR56573.1 Abortive infection protein [Paenibacillus riograndensis SBR5]
MTTNWTRRVTAFFVNRDPEYESFLRQHEAASRRSILFYLSCAILPGFLAYLLIYPLRPRLMELTGLSSHYIQFLVLAVMASGWHIFFPLFMLKFVDKLTWKQTFTYLGFRKGDAKGLFVILPIITIIFTVLSLPYMKWMFPPLSAFLDSIPALRMGEWHIYHQGYYDFPWPLLVIGLIGNFIGEEIYFRGFLLKKIGRLRFDWLLVSVLFQFYHMWQAPMNWAFIPLAVVIPCEILVKLRKNLYGAILFHIYINTIWGAVTLYLVGV